MTEARADTRLEALCDGVFVLSVGVIFIMKRA